MKTLANIKKPTLMQATQINKKQKEIVEDESKTER